MSNDSLHWAWMPLDEFWPLSIPMMETTFGSYQREKPVQARERIMRDEYDFSKAKRGAVITDHGKERITIFLDKDILSEFRRVRKKPGAGIKP